MGVSIILKNANFLKSSIGNERNAELMPNNKTISVIVNSEYFGTERDITLHNRLALKDNIFIPNGASINLSGLKGVDGLKNPLRVDWVAYSINERKTEYAVTTASKGIEANYFPLNINGSNSVEIVNDTGQDAWFGFCFSGLTKDEKIYRDDYALSYMI